MSQHDNEQFELNTALHNFDESVLRSGTVTHGDEEEPDEPPVQG